MLCHRRSRSTRNWCSWVNCITKSGSLPCGIGDHIALPINARHNSDASALTRPPASASSVLQVRDSELFMSHLFRSPLALDILADDLERGSTTGRRKV